MARIGRAVSARLEAHPRIQKIESSNPLAPAQIYVYQDFLSAAECADLVAKIDAGATPSILYKGKNTDGFRTSYSCNLDRWDAEVMRIDDRLCGLMGLDPRQGETLQGQRYQPGQYFNAHHDFFHTDQPYWQLEKPYGGQRCWTAMIFLNEPGAGGETEFPHLGFKMLPRTGMAMIWNNMGEDGAPNYGTLHSGNPVDKGTKYIVTKWFREGHWMK